MMYTLYNIGIYALEGAMRLHALFNKKSAKAVEGRKDWQNKLRKQMEAVSRTGRTVWFHASSLGEFEQGRPVIESLRAKYPSLRIVLTFFSPSGYCVRHDYQGADVVAYMPLDTPAQAAEFLDIVRPDAVLFIKYEFWVNFLREIHRREIPLYLVSARFKKDGIFFKSYGGLMRSLLPLFTHIYTQDPLSESLLDSLGGKNHSLCGDTRFDRVLDILSQDNHLDFMDTFSAGRKVLVAGSTWDDDYRVMSAAINHLSHRTELCYVIAPHEMDRGAIERFRQSLSVPSVLYSQMRSENLKDAQVLILDTVGILTKVYSYAHISFVGGGWTPTGIHNVLEPAVFSRPVICGPLYSPYVEAVDMHRAGGLIVINDEESLIGSMTRCLDDAEYYSHVASAAGTFVKDNSGATAMICDDVSQVLER